MDLEAGGTARGWWVEHAGGRWYLWRVSGGCWMEVEDAECWV